MGVNGATQHSYQTCRNEWCGPGRICTVKDEGGKPKAECTDDPCDKVTCPSGFACERGTCVNKTIISTSEFLATGAGGFACATAPSGTPSAPPLGLVFLALGLVVVLVSRRD